MTIKIRSLLQLLFLCLVLFSWITADPLVKLPQGLLKGTTLITRNGRNISVFLGIPYAEPPIGERRFSNPVSAKKWHDIRLADKEANFCPQIETQGFIGDEDCLYLNVFTPLLEFNSSMSQNTSGLLPVMVRIHGGFLVGSSNFTYYGPNYLLDKDVILVSMNYRLGILGFFATGDSVVAGNFGLKDQVLALKWVQKNIRAFGGDPNRVTLFGESAGGACVGLHALSDASNDNSTHIVKCLREKSAYTLLMAVPYDGFNYSKLGWVPTDEIESEDAFLTTSPQNLIAKKKKLKDYPSMSGNVGDEGLSVTLFFYMNMTPSVSVRRALEKYINSTSYQYMKPTNLSKFRRIINNYYFNESVLADKSELLKSFTKFVSDCRFIYPVVSLENGIKENIGVTHGEELLYHLLRVPLNTASKVDQHMIDVMVDLWTSFAINGKPSSNLLDVPNLWQPYMQKKSFLQIGSLTNNNDPSITL